MRTWKVDREEASPRQCSSNRLQAPDQHALDWVEYQTGATQCLISSSIRRHAELFKPGLIGLRPRRWKRCLQGNFLLHQHSLLNKKVQQVNARLRERALPNGNGKEDSANRLLPPPSPPTRLLDIRRRIRGFAAGLAMIDFHLANPPSRGNRLLLERRFIAADGDQRHVHRVPRAIGGVANR